MKQYDEEGQHGGQERRRWGGFDDESVQHDNKQNLKVPFGQK